MNSDTQASAHARGELLSSVERGETFHAIQAARALLHEDPGIRQLSFIRKVLESAAAQRLSLRPFRVALLSSFSIEFIHSALIAHGFLNKLRIEIYQSGFGQFQQEILDPRSGLYAFSPDAAILAVEGRDLVPALYQYYLDSPKTGIERAVSAASDGVATLVRAFRKNSPASFLIHNFALPVWRRLGILDGQVGVGQAQAIHRLNEALQTTCRGAAGTYVVDYAGLVNRYGALHWYDERMDHYAKAPIAQTMLGHLAAEHMKFFRGLTGQTKKCLVLDLDNTLWGGILGEEGITGIQLGPNYPGSAYVAFQEEVLNLRRRGVILAVASRNNPADAEEVFANHPHMVLKKEHFANLEVNWKPKSESLIRIAETLGIGLEHIVVVDDNPAECQQIVCALPEVTAIPLPKQPELYVRALLQGGLFDTPTISAEDRRRAELYQQRAQAEALRVQSGSLEEFYRSLRMKVVFSPVGDASLARAAQLTRKTNQFNVTTIRYSEAELSPRMADPNWLLTTVTVQDRFGDNGIVGLMMARIEVDQLEIDTFLLSCRVIGRTIETAMLAYLCEQAVRRGIKFVRGRVRPTAKNLPARDVFERHGFKRSDAAELDGSSWTLDVEPHTIPRPEWIRVLEETPKKRTQGVGLQPIGVKNAGTN